MVSLLTSKFKMVALAGVAATGLAAGSQAASARDHFSIGLSLPIFASPAPFCVEQPAVVAPIYAPPCAPVVVAPAPMVVYAAPVYEPAPYVVYRPEHLYFRSYRGRHW